MTDNKQLGCSYSEWGHGIPEEKVMEETNSQKLLGNEGSKKLDQPDNDTPAMPGHVSDSLLLKWAE